MTRSGIFSRHRCGIVPPHILERLSRSADPQIAAAAREVLIDIDAGLLHRRGHARPAPGSARPRLGTGTLASGPVRLVSDAQSGTDLPGVRVRGEGDPDTGDIAVTEAYDGLGATWQLFAEAFARNSLDGRGLPLRATVHYGREYDNAFWDGTQMVFGDGDGRIFGRFTASLDVIAHELAHGVTEHTAGLMYQGQPGALNESMSDVFGSLVKQHRLGQGANEADWLIGADLLIGELAGQALRSMKAPGTAYDNPILGRDPQPGHLDDYVETDLDHGGVHINSGIPNRAFYLVASALDGPAWEVAGRIWYAVLTGPGISADCDFVTFAGLTVDEAIARYGVASAPAAAVRAAWAAVGVLGGPEDPVPFLEAEDAGDSGSSADGSDSPADGVGHHEPSPDDFEHEGEVPSDAVVAVTRSGGFAGLTLRREVALRELPAPQARAWRRVLGRGTLRAIEDGTPGGSSGAASLGERGGFSGGAADFYCYEVSCATPATHVQLAEYQLPEAVRHLLDETLRGDRGDWSWP